MGGMLTIDGDTRYATIANLLGDHFFQRMKPYEHASGNIKYLCKNKDIEALETDADWLIWKFTDADIPTKEGPRIGAVDTEGAIDGLSWNI